MRRTQTDPREDRKPQRNLQCSNLPQRHQHQSTHPQEKRETFTPPVLSSGHLLVKVVPRRASTQSPTGAEEAERARWRPEEEADREQFSILSAQHE